MRTLIVRFQFSLSSTTRTRSSSWMTRSFMSSGLPRLPHQLVRQRPPARYHTFTSAKSAADAGILAPPGPISSDGTKSTFFRSRDGSTEKEIVSISPCAAAQERMFVSTPYLGALSGRYGTSVYGSTHRSRNISPHVAASAEAAHRPANSNAETARSLVVFMVRTPCLPAGFRWDRSPRPARPATTAAGAAARTRAAACRSSGPRGTSRAARSSDRTCSSTCRASGR